jgi:hypothetical protein
MKQSAELLLVSLIILSGCASIVEGRSEQVMINTSPDNAKCSILRKGESIATVPATPGSALIEKTKDDITIHCVKQGYEDATFMDHSGIDSWTYGNIALGGLIGWAIDSSAGADNYYDTPVNITLPKQ